MRTLSPLVNNLVISEAMYHIKGGHTVRTSGGKEGHVTVYSLAAPRLSAAVYSRVSL